jgi:hypothetical protein
MTNGTYNRRLCTLRWSEHAAVGHSSRPRPLRAPPACSPARIEPPAADEASPASASASAGTPYEWWVTPEAGKGWMSFKRRQHARRATGSHRSGMEARTHAAVSPFIGVVANDTLDAKVRYHLHFSASMPGQSDQMVPCTQLMAEEQLRQKRAHRMDRTVGPQSVPNRVSEKKRAYSQILTRLRLEHVIYTSSARSGNRTGYADMILYGKQPNANANAGPGPGPVRDATRKSWRKYCMIRAPHGQHTHSASESQSELIFSGV